MTPSTDQSLNSQRPQRRPNKRTTGIDHHRASQLMPRKEIAHSTTGDTKERTPREPIEEPADDHRLDILRHRAWDQPD